MSIQRSTIMHLKMVQYWTSTTLGILWMFSILKSLKDVMVFCKTILFLTRAKRGVSPSLKIWPSDLDLWPWKSIGFQILLRTKYVPSLVKIHWRMLILECSSQGCYGTPDGQKEGRTVALLYPFPTSLERG